MKRVISLQELSHFTCSSLLSPLTTTDWDGVSELTSKQGVQRCLFLREHQIIKAPTHRDGPRQTVFGHGRPASEWRQHSRPRLAEESCDASASAWHSAHPGEMEEEEDEEETGGVSRNHAKEDRRRRIKAKQNTPNELSVEGAAYKKGVIVIEETP